MMYIRYVKKKSPGENLFIRLLVLEIRSELQRFISMDLWKVEWIVLYSFYFFFCFLRSIIVENIRWTHRDESFMLPYSETWYLKPTTSFYYLAFRWRCTITISHMYHWYPEILEKAKDFSSAFFYLINADNHHYFS